VTTSNRHPDDLYKNGLNRDLFVPFIDLIKTRLEVHQLESETDHRKVLLDRLDVYHSPLGPETTASLDKVWEELTEGRGEPLELQVKGRSFTIPMFHGGIARASFKELCEAPLGPADFLALSTITRVLILDDIPCMQKAEMNPAKRFITLIDTLYEAKIRLICSAAAPPLQLYLDGENSFEFERTVSRLIEMQGANWGKEAA
jgi:cell division protein ZapE